MLFAGYLGFGCERRTTPAGFILEYWQYIEYAGGVNYYSCMERCQGCHSEDDCKPEHLNLTHCQPCIGFDGTLIACIQL
jgi:hypothetical protein